MVTQAPVVAGVTLGAADLREFVIELMNKGGAGRGVGGPVEEGENTSLRVGDRPPAVNKLLASKACRKAIKFGDPLTHQECVELMEGLGQCSFPFNCAHGRPSMTPLYTVPVHELPNGTKPAFASPTPHHILKTKKLLESLQLIPGPSRDWERLDSGNIPSSYIAVSVEEVANDEG